MKFKEALKKAGLPKPGRSTWCGTAIDGTPVFTIWRHEVRQLNGRFFAWWDHTGERGSDGELSKRRKGQAKTFIALVAANIDRPCRAVIVNAKKKGDDSSVGAESAEYPHPKMARVVFRFVEQDVLQFIAELSSEN